MGWDNVPDDWGAYGGTCSECGHYWHASGSYECKCEPCENDDCDNLAWEDGYCHTCYETKDHVECVSCEERFDFMDLYCDGIDDTQWCEDCWNERLNEYLEKNSIRWKKIEEHGYCLHEIMEQAQKDRRFLIANKAQEAIRRLYKE
tara:strand:- start:1186 stop:1623 length:438 start_codon:yes stop_codon:yes gene_type:complete